MFEFLFKFPLTAYQKGELVFLRGWPVWVPAGLFAICAAWVFWRLTAKPMPRARRATVGVLDWLLLAALVLLVWQPALSTSRLEPQQNVIAVVVDTSRSMAIGDAGGARRIDAARRLLDGELLAGLRKKFPVRLYQGGGALARIESTAGLNPVAPVTRLSDLLEEAAAESATLPIGAVVLLSDGGDNRGGIDSEAVAALRRARIPVHTVGLGEPGLSRDVEITGVELSSRSLAGARLAAAVSVRQGGFSGRPARLTVRDGEKVIATTEMKLPGDGLTSRQTIAFPAGSAGARTFRFSVEPLDGEKSTANNAMLRLVQVEDRRPKILYFEGEPRWEYKFIRRASESDPQLKLASILRTTQNKFYRQGVDTSEDLRQGFPVAVEELFSYEALVIGNVEASYFTASQQSLIREFADRRGGGVLFLGGRAALSDGGWQTSPAAEMLPVALPANKGTFHRDPATPELTGAGRDSLLMRLEENPEKNAARWKTMPYLADYQATGAPKPGALVLLELVTGTRARFPLLVTQNYGRGRVGLFATGGSWRWQMAQDSRDQTHEIFWRQLLRWLASPTPGHVEVVLPRTVFSDESKVPLRAEVRDTNYMPAVDAAVEARVIGPGGLAASVPMTPDALTPGVYNATWEAAPAGSYVAEIVATRGGKEIGRQSASFLREDGVAENFRTEQNKELLERLAESTGGKYWTPSQASKLAGEVDYSEAGIAVREARDIWDAPVVFLVLAGLKAASWLLRRRWGAV
jgi:uncharacterized membrane protein